MYDLKIQSDTVIGEISLTCDAFQASNTDGYFAVTGHWIEELSPGVWKLESALLGFTGNLAMMKWKRTMMMTSYPLR